MECSEVYDMYILPHTPSVIDKNAYWNVVRLQALFLKIVLRVKVVKVAYIFFVPATPPSLKISSILRP